MSDNINLIRVDNDGVNLANRVPRGSILFQEDTGVYYITKRATAAGDTITSMLRSASLDVLIYFFGSYPDIVTLTRAKPTALNGCYAFIYDPRDIDNVQIAVWDDRENKWELTGSGGVNPVGIIRGRKYLQGELVNFADTLYVVTKDFLSTGDFVQDLNNGNLKPIAGSSSAVKPWKIGDAFKNGDLLYDPAGTGLFVAVKDFTAAGTPTADLTANNMVRALTLPQPFEPKLFDSAAHMLTGSTTLKKGEYAVVIDPTRHVLDGVYVAQKDTPAIISDFTWLRGASNPADTSIPNTYKWDYQTQEPMWADGRTDFMVVGDTPDLSNRAVVPRNMLALGKLVYVRSTSKMYQFIASGTPANDLTDWREIGSGGVKFVGRITDLPDPKAARPVDGALYVIKLDFEGDDLYRVVAWDDTLQGAIQTYNVTPLPFDPTHKLADGAAVTAVFTAGPVNEGAWYTIEHAQGATPLAGEPFAGIHLPFGTKLLDLGDPQRGTAGWQILPPDTGYAAGGTPAVPGMQVVADSSLTRVVGGWRFLNRESYINALLSDEDHPLDNQLGDFQSTIEGDKRVLKVYTQSGWITLFSETEIKGWIASLALFRGTISEDPTVHQGTLDVATLPDLAALSAAQDNTPVGRYWIWAGQDSYPVRATGGTALTKPALGTSAGWTGTAAEVAMTPGQIGHWYDITALTGFNGTFPLTLNAPVQVTVPMSNGTNVVMTIAAKTYPDAATTDGGSATAVNGLGWQMNYDGLPPGIAGVMPVVDGNNLFLRVDGAGTAAKWPVGAGAGVIPGTPRIGTDLNGASLNVGDWLVIADRGTGVAGDPNEVDLHWVRIGGDLLTKTRGDNLFGLNPWRDGTFEQGAVISHAGDIYKARAAVQPGDLEPGTTLAVQVPPPGIHPVTDVAGSVIATQADLERFCITNPPPVQWASYAVNGTFNVIGASDSDFDGLSLLPGEHMIWTGYPNLDAVDAANQIQVIKGWLHDPGTVTTPGGTAAVNISPYLVNEINQVAPQDKWAKIPIGGGVKFLADDAALPVAGHVGDSYLILQSLTYGGGQPAIVTWDPGTATYVPVSSGGAQGDPMNFMQGDLMVGIGCPIGTIVFWASATIPAGWLPLTGQTIDATRYPELAALFPGGTLPNTSGQFIRVGAIEAGFTRHQWTTGRPRHDFITAADGMHLHSGGFSQSHNNWSSGGGGGPHLGYGANTGRAGEHHHRITGGGDTETAPDHIILGMIIKAEDKTARIRP